MQTSPSISEIAPAFVEFQGEVKNPELNAANPFFKSNYADLPSILKAARELLFKHGLAVHQEVNAEGIYTLLIHRSGEWILSGPLPLITDKASMQSEGSAITYGRRYGLCAILGIAGEADNDGNTAEPPKPEAKPQHQKAEGPRTPGGATVKQVNFVKKLFVDAGIARAGAKGEDDEAKQVRRDDNMIAVYQWLQDHRFDAPDGTDPLEQMSGRDISEVIDTLKAEMEERQNG